MARDVDWENALEGACVAGMFYVYAGVQRLRRVLLGVVRTPGEVLKLVRLVRRVRGSRVEVYRAQACGRRRIELRRVMPTP